MHHRCAWWLALLVAVASMGAIDARPVSGDLVVAAEPLVPAGATRFVPLAPVRFLDTREPSDVTGGAAVPQGGSIDVQITGRLGVPSSGVTAVVLNLTAAEALAPGFVTVWPAGQKRPLAANLNVTEVGQNIGNLVTVRLGAGGKISLFSQSGTHFVADVAGYYTPVAAATSAGRYRALSPARLLDTREALGVPTTTVVPPGGVVELTVAGRGGVPASGVGAVVLGVAAANATAPGFVTVWPNGQPRPLAASLNVTFAGQNIQNAVIVPLGADGRISLFSQSGTHLVVDVSGWFGDASQPASIEGLYVPVAPVRILDTREATGVPGIQPVPAGGSIDVAVTGAGGVPTSGVTAAVINLTAAAALAPGFVSVWPTGAERPLVASVNVTSAGQNIGSMVTATLGADGRVSLFSQSGTHLIADLAGYYTNVASPPGGKLQVTANVGGSGGVLFPANTAGVMACPTNDIGGPANCLTLVGAVDADGDGAVQMTIDPNLTYLVNGFAMNQPWCNPWISPNGGTKFHFGPGITVTGPEIDGRGFLVADPCA